MKTLTAHEIWTIVQIDKLTEDQHKQMLVDNGIIVKKSNDSPIMGRGYCAACLRVTKECICHENLKHAIFNMKKEI